MHVTLIVPAPFDTVSGGYVYDRRIVQELRSAGHTVEVSALCWDRAPPARAQAARAAWDALAADTIPVIDGLALPAFDGLEAGLASRRAAALIHHPTSLELGLTEAERAALKMTETRIFGAAHRVIVTSETTAEQLNKEFAVDPDRLEVVAPGTDDAPRAMGSGGPTCEILAIGTLIPRKGHDVLMRALARLFDLDWHLTIVGNADRDPVHARGLVALAENLAITQRVRFAGEVVEAALDALWAKADIFALATHYEGYGMAIAEALKRGLPVAVTAGGAAGLLVPPEAGAVCPPGDRDQLSKSLRRMIFSRELRAEIAEASWQTGQTLPSWATQASLFARAIA